MEQPYSVVADWLSKFHTWPEPIQALWLVAVPATLLGMTWIVMRSLTRILALTSRRHMICGVYQDAQGRWMISRHDGKPQEIDWPDPPFGPTGRGNAVRGVLQRLES